MKLYDLHKKGKELHRFKEADEETPDYFWEKYKDHPEELKKREKAIAKSAKYSYLYARHVLGDRFKLGEPTIFKDPETAYWYVMQLVKKPTPEAEGAIAKSATSSVYYALNILKGPFPKGEKAIATDNWATMLYLPIIKRPFPAGEKVIAEKAASSLEYAMRYLKKPFPEGEDAIADGKPLEAYQYANLVLGGRFKKGEKKIAEDPELAMRYALSIMKTRWYPSAEKEIIERYRGVPMMGNYRKLPPYKN